MECKGGTALFETDTQYMKSRCYVRDKISDSKGSQVSFFT